jgi:hypothetical protein
LNLAPIIIAAIVLYLLAGFIEFKVRFYKRRVNGEKIRVSDLALLVCWPFNKRK